MNDARGAETHFTFNTDGQPTEVCLPSRLRYGYEYNAAGRLQKVNRLETNEVTRTLAAYKRDGFGQITKATYPDGLSSSRMIPCAG